VSVGDSARIGNPGRGPRGSDLMWLSRRRPRRSQLKEHPFVPFVANFEAIPHVHRFPDEIPHTPAPGAV